MTTIEVIAITWLLIQVPVVIGAAYLLSKIECKEGRKND